MMWNLVPMTLSRTAGNCPVSLLGLIAPIRLSFFIASSIVLIPEVCQETQTLTSENRLPSQFSLRGSYLTPLVPNIARRTIERWTAPITVPSLGATLATKLVATSPPAPGMYWIVIVGLPGMYSPMCRCSRRAYGA